VGVGEEDVGEDAAEGEVEDAVAARPRHQIGYDSTETRSIQAKKQPDYATNEMHGIYSANRRTHAERQRARQQRSKKTVKMRHPQKRKNR
jgi:hypothetical protein